MLHEPYVAEVYGNCGIPTSTNQHPLPRGSKYRTFKDSGPKSILLMAFGTRLLKTADFMRAM